MRRAIILNYLKTYLFRLFLIDNEGKGFQDQESKINRIERIGHKEKRHCEERSDEAIQRTFSVRNWIASLRSQ
jgi:hypothetical protein